MTYTALDYDPYEGDFGDSGDKIFSDKLVKARKEHQCSHCGNAIAKDTTYRYRAEVYDGTLHAIKWCGECCNAMVQELVNDADIDDKWDGESYPFQERRIY